MQQACFLHNDQYFCASLVLFKEKIFYAELQYCFNTAMQEKK